MQPFYDQSENIHLAFAKNSFKTNMMGKRLKRFIYPSTEDGIKRVKDWLML